MNSRIGLLGAIMLVQLVIIAVVMLVPGTAESDRGSLLVLEAADVTSLVIGDGDNEVEVTKGDGGWQVAGLAADSDKISTMLDKLASLSAPWPVATSSGSAERFEVGDENYQRRVRIGDGSALLGELYLGTSPGYQRVHARVAASDEIYSVQLSNYELGVNTDAWLDKGLLATSGTPDELSLDFIADPEPRQEQLLRSEEGWLYNGAAADQDAARTYANRFTTLRVLGVAADDVEAKALANITISEAGGTWVLTLAREGEGEDGDYIVGDDRSDGKYRMSAYVAEQLLMTDADFSSKDVEPESRGDESEDPKES